MSRWLNNGPLTGASKEFDSDQGLRCTGPNRSIRVLKASLQEFDKAPHG